MKKILLIEDDPAIRRALLDDFRHEGYAVDYAVNGEDGLKMGQNLDYDIILLDLMLPGLDGLEICKELRKKDVGTPIIMVTAKSQDWDKVIGLELGADDYVTKPFSPFELRARVKAVLRRTSDDARKNTNQQLQSGSFVLNTLRHECTQEGEPLTLTQIEFNLMHLFLSRPGEVLKRDEILEFVWGENVMVTTRTVDTHVGNLRRKIGDNPDDPKWIMSVRNMGYKWIG